MGNCAVIFIHTQLHKNKTQFTAERCSHRRTRSTYTRAHDCGAYEHWNTYRSSAGFEPARCTRRVLCSCTPPISIYYIYYNNIYIYIICYNMSFVPYASPMILYRIDVVVVSRNRRWHTAAVFYVITCRVCIAIYIIILCCFFFGGGWENRSPWRGRNF